MNLHALPQLAKNTTREGRWFLRLESATRGRIHGSAKGRLASWIELEDLVILPARPRRPGHVELRTPAAGVVAGHVEFQLTKRPDVSSPALYTALVRRDRLKARAEFLVEGRTRLALVMTDALLLTLFITPRGHESMGLVPERVEIAVGP